ncbi:branched-chain amino acid ABC transporter substrate-binding protein [Bacillus wiedmannii]|uniref:branched-chain amino acid ABC transporter substrate-binding protein n=1 Tax=Bacillus wiedmannii TaxID=1890302 RepID=UPI0015CF63BB|nr:branched-chain amino acid ABC transporter substrate-binding protein [Bacillus wiedmannii]
MVVDAIKFGAAGALSGIRTAQTPQFYNGVKIAVDHWNLNNSVKAEVVWGDDQAKAKIAPEVARDFLSQKVEGVVGHFSSICALKASTIYMEKNVPLILPAATNSMLTKQKNVFRMCATDDESSKLIANVSINIIKANRIAFISDSSFYGMNHIESIYKETIKIKKIDAMVMHWKEHNDVITLVEQILGFNPNLIIFSGRCHDAVHFMNSFRKNMREMSFVFGDDVIVKEFTDNVNSTEGNIWAVGPAPIPLNDISIQFIDEYESIVGSKPGFYAASTYASVQLLLQSIMKNRLENVDLLDVIAGNEFETIIGNVKFDSNHELKNQPISLWNLKSEIFVPIK